MEKQQYEIECGRCGETNLDFLTEEEARVTSDGIGPAYRPCERCGKVTGWITARSKRAEDPALAPPLASAEMAERLIPRGQERMATLSERDEVNSILHRSDGL